MWLAYRRGTPRHRHDPAANGLPGQHDRGSAQDAHLAIGRRVLVRPEGSASGMSRRPAAKSLANFALTNPRRPAHRFDPKAAAAHPRRAMAVALIPVNLAKAPNLPPRRG